MMQFLTIFSGVVIGTVCFSFMDYVCKRLERIAVSLETIAKATNRVDLK